MPWKSGFRSLDPVAGWAPSIQQSHNKRGSPRADYSADCKNRITRNIRTRTKPLLFMGAEPGAGLRRDPEFCALGRRWVSAMIISPISHD